VSGLKSYIEPRHTCDVDDHVLWLHNVQNHGSLHGYHVVCIELPETLHGTEFAGLKNRFRFRLILVPCPVFSPLLRFGADVLCVSAIQDLDDEQLSRKRNWCVKQPTEPIPARYYASSIDLFLRMFQGNMADVPFALPKPARYMR
jgi:hypothetical protein